MLNYKNILVAHRGDHLSVPENSISSLQTAMEAGAQFFEFDLQLSKDLQPFVGHDVNLLRTTGKDINIFKTLAQDLKDLLPDLKLVVDLLNQNKKATVFVEIKRQSVDEFGAEIVLKTVLQVLQAAKFKPVIISYKPEIISLAHERGFKTGWVSDAFNQNVIVIANNLQVDYMFTKASEILKQTGFEKSWQLAVYTVNDSTQVDMLLKHDVDLVETDHFSKLYKELSYV